MKASKTYKIELALYFKMIISMIQRLVIIVLLMVFQPKIYAQENDANLISRNTVYVEILGSAGVLYNITYDRLFSIDEKNKISTGIGFQYLPMYGYEIVSFSPRINYLRGKKHYFETGLGLIYDAQENEYLIPIRFGYRFQKPDGGFFAKVGFTPLYFPDFWGSPALIP
ncbi:MAG: hypothetical protein GY816_16605 [Cytophagales bacterium]|nr:hypothetical protein [Cytophagales bacterium]